MSAFVSCLLMLLPLGGCLTVQLQGATEIAERLELHVHSEAWCVPSPLRRCFLGQELFQPEAGFDRGLDCGTHAAVVLVQHQDRQHAVRGRCHGFAPGLRVGSVDLEVS